MTAKEMFEELGFEYDEDNEKISYVKHSTRVRIVFYKKEREYFCDSLGFIFNIKVHLAINKQFKELGWIK